MAEFPASAQTMVGNHSGSCLLHLTGAAITIKYVHGEEIASWPYNVIRQFRTDEDTRQFSFFSGRRGPFGVAEYKFDMTESMLQDLQDALTQFTGAQFGTKDMSGGSTSSTGSLNITASDPRYVPESFRNPKRAPLPDIPSTPPGSSEMFAGYTTHMNTELMHSQKHSATDVFATLSKEQRHRRDSSSPGKKPPKPAPYDSRTLDMRAKRGSAPHLNHIISPSPSHSTSTNSKYTYHDVAGNFASQGGWGNSVFGSPSHSQNMVGKKGNRKMSHGDEVFRSHNMSPARSSKLARQGTAPSGGRQHHYEDAEVSKQARMVSGLVSPAPAESSPPSENGGTSDLDFGNPKLRRSSPQVDRKNTRIGRVSPSNSQHPRPPLDLYSVPRPATSSSTSSPPLTESVYNVPRSHTNDGLSQESAGTPTFTVSPTEKENLYNVPKPVGNGSDLYSSPRPQRQSSEEVDGGGSVIYNVPPTRPMMQPPMVMVKPQENGHELYNTPRPAVMENGHETYNVPRAALETHQQQDDEGLYKVPCSSGVEAAAVSDNVYNVPRTAEKRRGNYDSLEAVRDDAIQYQRHAGAKQKSSSGGSSPVQNQPNFRQPLPNPGQDTYSVPRPVNSSPLNGRRSDTRYPYEYVDHELPRVFTSTLKSSRSLESLVTRRVRLRPEASSPQLHAARTHRTPPPRHHKYIEIDIDEPETTPAPAPVNAGVRSENLYAEIPDGEPIRRSSHPSNLSSSLQSNMYTTVPSNIRASAINYTPAPHSSGAHLTCNSGSFTVSDAARALHEEGYELVLPAEEVARKRALYQQQQQQQQQQQHATPPRNISRVKTPVSQSHSINMATDGYMARGGGGTILSSSGPIEPNPLTDEYVIVNRRDVHQPTQPRDIPVPAPQLQGRLNSSLGVSTSAPRPIQDEEYEVMTSVQLQVKQIDKSGNSQSDMVPPIPMKKRGSVSRSRESTPASSRGDPTGLRDSVDLDSIETGSRASVGSMNQFDDVVGPLSPSESGLDGRVQSSASVLSHPQSIQGKRNVVRIASGSPHDLAPSKDLRSRSHSKGNILDQAPEDKPQKYENVTDQDIAAKLALSAGGQPPAVPKKLPMPLPRPTRSEH